MHPIVQTIDLNFDNTPGVIAVYVIHHARGAVIVDTGPSSTIPRLEQGLHALGLTPRDITDVLLTHIHLDHAGASWWLAQNGARIHVHPVGAPHLLNPDKLLASAKRIYQDDMDRLWGAFHPVAPEHLTVEHDTAEIVIGGLHFRALETLGHAEHHFAYLFDDIVFAGDIGGIRINGIKHIWFPTPPPEVHLGKWRASVKRLQVLDFKYLAPTHFGIVNDPAWHLASLARAIDEIDQWLESAIADNPTPEVFRERVADLYIARGRADGLDDAGIRTYQVAASAWMAADGLYRYWKKYRTGQTHSNIPDETHKSMSTRDICNYRQVNDQFITGGQPNEEQLASVAAEGYTTVINLATLNPRYSLKDEAGLARSLGMTYYHIPVDWDNPKESDFQIFEQVMQQLGTAKTLIHCAANFRVTAFYSLYALKNLGWSEEQADEFRSSIWRGSDYPVWEDFIRKLKAQIKRA